MIPIIYLKVYIYICKHRKRSEKIHARPLKVIITIEWDWRSFNMCIIEFIFVNVYYIGDKIKAYTFKNENMN